MGKVLACLLSILYNSATTLLHVAFECAVFSIPFPAILRLDFEEWIGEEVGKFANALGESPQFPFIRRTSSQFSRSKEGNSFSLRSAIRSLDLTN